MKSTYTRLIVCQTCKGVGEIEYYNPYTEESVVEDCKPCAGLGVQLQKTVVEITSMTPEELQKRREVKHA